MAILVPYDCNREGGCSVFGEMARPSVVVALHVVLNLTSAISIVFINKLIYLRYGFPSITLTLVHFAVTGLGMRICSWLHVFSPKGVPLSHLLPLCATFCGFVVLTNLSLQSNTVGTYQLAKAMTTPIILVVQAGCYGKPTSLKVMLTIIPVIFGIFLNSCYDVHFNVLGTVYAVSGAMVTAVYQIVSEEQGAGPQGYGKGEEGCCTVKGSQG
ncbi:hypothetical protein EMCRGX_G001647 [Ephydatia muelleri]